MAVVQAFSTVGRADLMDGGRHRKVKRAKRRVDRDPLPELRTDVPKWLERRYGVPAVPNPYQPGEFEPLPTSLPGLNDARKAAIEYALHRDGPALRTRAAVARIPERAASLYRKSVEADLAATTELRPGERKELFVRFLTTLMAVNTRVLDAPPPAGANLPLDALICVAWWEGYWRTRPTTNTVRAVRRLLARRA